MSYMISLMSGVRISLVSLMCGVPDNIGLYNPFISLIINNWSLLFKYLLSFCFHILSSFSLKFMYIYFKCCIHVII